jgi:hypothetical protein
LNFEFQMKLFVFLWESAAADRDGIVAGSHSHKGDTSLPTRRRRAPQPAFCEPIVFMSGKKPALLIGQLPRHRI